MELENGYKMVSTFPMDFTIADAFGVDAIKDTYKRAFNGWKDNYIYLTELVITLNMKIWEWFEKEGKTSTKAILYNDLWHEADNYACENLKGEELSFFYNTTD